MQYQRGVRLFWPIILIGVGSILLLTNLGVIHGNPWTIIFQLWPVLLIALGLEILLGGSTGWRAVMSALLGLALVGGVLWILIVQPPIPGLNFGSSNLQSTNISQPLNGVKSARAELSFGAGTSKVYALNDSNNLIEGQLQTYSAPNFSVSTSNDRATIVLGPGPVNVPIIFPSISEENWEVGLNSSVAYQIDLNVGVGQSTIDLTKLDISGGGIDGGVGTSEIYLPGKGTYRLTINGGVGTIRIYVPSGLAVRAEVNGGLGSFNRLPSMQEVHDHVYETPGFSSAENAVTLIIDGGVGSISMYESE
jgi:LiaI-LiaF-like transmembrane region